MNKLPPIPEELLIHEIKYEEFVKEGSRGSIYSSEETIKKINVQLKTQFKRDSNNQEVLVRGVIYLDREHTPKFKPLLEQSKVWFNNMELRVVSCDYLYDYNPNSPHHYEVGIV